MERKMWMPKFKELNDMKSDRENTYKARS